MHSSTVLTACLLLSRLKLRIGLLLLLQRLARIALACETFCVEWTTCRCVGAFDFLDGVCGVGLRVGGGGVILALALREWASVSLLAGLKVDSRAAEVKYLPVLPAQR